MHAFFFFYGRTKILMDIYMAEHEKEDRYTYPPETRKQYGEWDQEISAAPERRRAIGGTSAALPSPELRRKLNADVYVHI